MENEQVNPEGDLNRLRLEVIRLTQETEDVGLLRQILDLLTENETVVYSSDGKPLTHAQMLEAIAEGERDIEAGRTISQEEMKLWIENELCRGEESLQA